MAASFPHAFFLGSHNSQVLPLVTRGLLPHVLKSTHKICLHSTQLYGVLKNSKGGDYSNLTKGETFLVSLKLSVVWGNLTLHHPCLPLPKIPLSFILDMKTISGHLFEKIFLVCFSPLSHRQRRKRMMNTLLIISRYM